MTDYRLRLTEYSNQEGNKRAMAMLGAAVYWECVRAGRRGSRWLLRTSYVALLCGLFCIVWQNLARGSTQASVVAIQDSLSAFHTALSFSQVMAALLLGPVFAAGSLIEERTGRTLPLLL